MFTGTAFASTLLRALCSGGVLSARQRQSVLQDATILILLWAGLASAWNIAGGFAGQISLGHAAFFGLGAYTSAAQAHFDCRRGSACCAEALVMLTSGFIAFAATRLRGPYFTLVTLAFAAVVQIIAARWYGLTRGNEGLSIPFQPGLGNFMFTGKLPWTLIVAGYVLLVYAVSVWIARSRFGFQLAGMREDEDAAQAIGIDTRLLKVGAIALSAFLTALGGSFYAQYVGFWTRLCVVVRPVDQVRPVCIIGGLGTRWVPSSAP